jgi:hypothetical protein
MGVETELLGLKNRYDGKEFRVIEREDGTIAVLAGDTVIVDSGVVPVTATTSSGGLGFSAQGVPVTGFACGIPFVLPPGDGGANGLSFTGGGGGAFTMTAAILAGGWNLLTDCYVYLPANVGGSGNTAGWYYAQFSSDTVGTIYADQYVSGQPTIPAAPAVFPGNPSGRITTTTSEITANTGLTLPAGALGKKWRAGVVAALRGDQLRRRQTSPSADRWCRGAAGSSDDPTQHRARHDCAQPWAA